MKTVLLILGVVIAILLIVPVFISEDNSVVRSIEVNAPVDVVYSVVKDYSYYKQWNSWSQMDKKDTKQEVSGPIGEVGSTWSWDGDTVGKGSLTIEALEPNKSIISRLEFIAPMEGIAQDLWEFEIIDPSKTKITWTYAGKANGYFMRYMNLAMDGFLGPMLETGLTNLKDLIENLPEPVLEEDEEEVAE